MIGPDPLDVSPYLTLPRRDIKSACRAFMQNVGKRQFCDTCTISDLCRKSVAHNDELSLLVLNKRFSRAAKPPVQLPEPMPELMPTPFRKAI